MKSLIVIGLANNKYKMSILDTKTKTLDEIIKKNKENYDVIKAWYAQNKLTGERMEIVWSKTKDL